MEILRWQALNPLANYQHIVCDTEQNAVLIDPLDSEQIELLVRKLSLKVKAILITHEHADHVGETERLMKLFRVPAYASAHCASTVSVANLQAVADRGELKFSQELRFKLHYTPGHTPGHAVIETDGLLFTGDCLFHAGCGHCRSAGANMEEHYRSLNTRLAALNPDLMLFPGHYYARRNLDFALHVEPDNRRAHDLRQRLASERDEMNHQTTLRQEREYNPFLRTDSRSLRRRLGELTQQDLTDASNLKIFAELRKLRDAW
jgi:hydroxyacylglutathione hydrolase